MSIQLGGTGKNISYLNLQKSGEEADNDPSSEQNCSVSLKFNTPFLAKQDEYLCAVTRFSVPLTQVPTIKDMGFEVRRHTPAGDDDKDQDRFDANLEPITADLACVQRNEVHTRAFIRPGNCFTFHQFLTQIQYELDNTYIQSTYTRAFLPADVDGSNNPTNYSWVNLDQSADNGFNLRRSTKLSERVKMVLTPDFRFQIMVCNDGFSDELCVKLSRGMFHMTQFQLTRDVPARQAHAGHTFLADEGRKDRTMYNDACGACVLGSDHKPYVGPVPPATGTAPAPVLDNSTDFATAANHAEITALVNGTYFVQSVLNQKRSWTVHTAPMCCADYNRCREIVFVSDMAVKSEGNTSGSYKRFLCDYQITDQTTFSYTCKDPHTEYGSALDPYTTGKHFLSKASTFTETLPSHRIYQSQNASAGRWQDLTLPVALYEVEVRARVRCWDYERSIYTIEDIPLPAGTQYSVKLIFVSKKTHFDATVSQTDRYHK